MFSLVKSEHKDVREMHTTGYGTCYIRFATPFTTGIANRKPMALIKKNVWLVEPEQNKPYVTLPTTCSPYNNLKLSIFLINQFLSFIVLLKSLLGIGAYVEEVLGVHILPSKRGYCCLTMYTYFSSFLCSCYLLIAMTFERFYSIIRPHKAASFNTVKKARITIVCTYLIWYSYGIPFIFICGTNEIFCVPNRFASDNVLGEIYHWLTEILTFVFPFISLLTMNSVIIHTLRKRSNQNILSAKGEGQAKGQNVKTKYSEN